MRYLTPRTALLGRGILSDQVPKAEELAARCYAKRWFKPRLLNGSLGLRIPSDCGSPYGLAASGDAASTFIEIRRRAPLGVCGHFYTSAMERRVTTILGYPIDELNQTA